MSKWYLKSKMRKSFALWIGQITKRTKQNLLQLITAVVTLLSILSFAIPVFAIDRESSTGSWFHRFFSDRQTPETVETLTDNQKALLEQGVVNYNESIIQNEYMITLVSVISDGYRFFFKFRIDAPSGKVLNADSYSLSAETEIDLHNCEDREISLVYSNGIVLEDYEPGDNSVTMLYEYVFQPPTNSGSPLASGRICICIDEILEYQGHKDETTQAVICRGNWDFDIEFTGDRLVTESTELLTSPTRCAAKRSLRNWNFSTKVKVTSFRLRALSATLLYDKPLTGFWEGIMLESIYLVMNDGTRVKAEFKTGLNRGSYMECIYLFEQPISYEDVAYVSFP